MIRDGPLAREVPPGPSRAWRPAACRSRGLSPSGRDDAATEPRARAQALVQQHMLASLERAVAGLTPGSTALPGADDQSSAPDPVVRRIVSFAADLFASYRGQHPELTAEEAVHAFHELAVSAAMRGAREARRVLGALAHEIAWDIHGTVELALDGLEALRDQLLSAAQQPGYPSAPSEAAA